MQAQQLFVQPPSVAGFFGTQRRGVQAWEVIALLVGCMYSPYGLFSLGGGTLRPDHLLVPLTFLWLLARRRLRTPCPLAIGLLAFAAVSLVSTLFNLDLAFTMPLPAAKTLEALLRGPLVLMVASSLDASEVALRRIGIAIVLLAVSLALFALVDRLAPPNSGLVESLVAAYGGPVDATQTQIGANHKEVLLMVGRATAVFVTAPALGMAAIFVLLLIITPQPQLGPVARLVGLVAVVIAGIACNSKSFLFSLPLAALSPLLAKRGRSRTALYAIPAVIIASATVVWLNSSGLDDRLLTYASVGGDVSGLTGGRLGGSYWTVWDPLITVLNDSPLLGYGLGEHPDIFYSDSAINGFVLHGGLVGLVAVIAGIAWQWRWYRQREESSEWVSLGPRVLLLAIAFFAAGAIFVMPRINDLLFTLLGVAVAAAHNTGSPKSNHVLAPQT